MMAGMAAGALVGGLAAYLVFTADGRRALARVNPTLDDLALLLQELRRALRKANSVAHEARSAMGDVEAMMAGAEVAPEV